MGSGLTAGDAYPIVATKPSGGTATIEDTSTLTGGTTTSLRVSSITATTGLALDIIYSTGEDGAGAQSYSMAATIIGFFFSGSDTRVRQEYYYELATTLTMDGALATFATITTPTKNGSLASTTNESGVTVGLNVQVTTQTVGDRMQFVLPWGTTFGTVGYSFTGTSDAFATMSSIESPTRFYRFPTVWGTSTVSTNSLTGGSVGTQITSVNTRISDYTTDTTGVNGWAIFHDNGQASTVECVHSATFDWKLTMGLANSTKPFTTCTISLTDMNTQSPATKAFT
jgi:hypothetical protein